MKLIITTLFTILLISLFSSSMNAERINKVSNTFLFKDNFNDNKANLAWKFIPDNAWHVKNGVLYCDSYNGDAFARIEGDDKWNDYVIELKIKRIEPNPDLIGRYQTGIKLRGIIIIMRDNQLYWYETRQELLRNQHFRFNKWYSIRLVCQDHVIKATIDGKELPLIYTTANKGGFDLWCYNQKVAFDDIIVYPLPAEEKITDKSSPNIVRNSSFEIATQPGLPDCWGSNEKWDWGLHKAQWTTQEGFKNWTEKYQRDSSSPFHGKSCMKISYPLALTSTSMRFPPPGCPFTFSTYLKADRENFPVLFKLFKHDKYKKEFSVGTKWKRYSMTITDKLPYASFHRSLFGLTVIPLKEGTLWVDAVQFEDGLKPTEYRPALVDNCYITSEKRDWEKGSDEPLEIYLQKFSGKFKKKVRPVEKPVPKNGSASINTKKRSLLLNGKPFIPVSPFWSSLPGELTLKYLKSVGFESIFVYFYPRDTDARIHAMLDAADRQGIKVIGYIGAVHGTLPFGQKSVERVKKLVSKFKDKPALIAWVVVDEPQAKPELVKRIYDTAKSIDSHHPVYINYALPELEKEFAGLPGDIVSLDYYPDDVTKVEKAACLLNLLGEKYDKPAFIILRCGGYTYNRYREPTPEEQEYMSYISLIRGLTGIQYFCGRPKSFRQWEKIIQINKEVKDLTPVLLAPQTKENISVSPDQVRYLFKEYDGSFYIIALNTSRKSVDVVFDLSTLSISKADVLFENRKLNATAGKIRDKFNGFQRHVYRFFKDK